MYQSHQGVIFQVELVQNMLARGFEYLNTVSDAAGVVACSLNTVVKSRFLGNFKPGTKIYCY